MRKRRKLKTHENIPYFTLKFLLTLLFGMVGGLMPILFLGGGVIILAMASGLAVTSFFLLVFGLIK